MAAPTWQIVRRRSALTASAPPALVAASAPIADPADILKSSGNVAARKKWQDEAWELFDRVGEFGFYVRWRARSCSRARLVASEIDDDGMPTGGIRDDDPKGQRFAEIVRQIAGGPSGQSQLVKRISEVLSVPGELYVAILQRPGGEQLWIAVTKEETEPYRRTIKITLPDGSKHEFNAANGDGIFRVWNPHARRASEPDSPVRSNLDPLREIVRTTKKIKNADLSRLISAGAFLIPQEASLPSSAGPTAGAEGQADPTAAGAKAAESVQQGFVRVATTAVQEGEDSMAALVPIVIAMPGEHINSVKHVTFADEATAEAIKIRNDAIARLAMGLDMAPEQLLGLGKNSNHWSAHQIGDEDVQLHVSPVLELICHAIYDNVLRNVLISEDIDPAKYTLWFDTSSLTVDPDKTDESQAAFEAGALNGKAYLRYQGFGDEDGYDLDTAEGWQQWARDAARRDPTLLPELQPLIPELTGIDFPQPVAALPPGQGGPPVDPNVVDAQQEPDTEDAAGGRQAAAIHSGRSLALNVLVERGLEFAGKRLRTRADHARLANVPIEQTHRFMPPVADADIPRLIHGFDAALSSERVMALGVDTESLRAEALSVIRRELTTPVIDGQVL